MSVEDLIKGLIVDTKKRIAEEEARGNRDLAMAMSCVQITLDELLVVLPVCSCVMSKEKNK